MKESIIQIPRAGESWVMGLVSMGILEVTKDGIRCKEKENAPLLTANQSGTKEKCTYIHYRGWGNGKRPGMCGL